MSATVFIDGAAGTTGLEIRERLARRDGLTLVEIDPARRKDAGARAGALNGADIVILCLPDDAAREAVALIDNPDTRVIDASTAHRTHGDWLYGFPELVGRDRIAAARRVSNPGCYSTGFIALVAPLVRAGLIAADRALTCNAVSGYSGGGKAMIAEYEAAGAGASAWRSYALGLDHKHVPEMQAHCGLTLPPLFVPAVVPVRSGMVVDVPLVLDGVTADDVRAAWRQAYAGSAIVRVAAQDGATLAVDALAGTDRLDLHVFGNAARGQLRLAAVLDNLGKGASGAAVQNLNIMLGVDEGISL